MSESNTSNTLISGFQPPQLQEINFCSLNYKLFGILLWQPSELMWAHRQMTAVTCRQLSVGTIGYVHAGVVQGDTHIYTFILKKQLLQLGWDCEMDKAEISKISQQVGNFNRRCGTVIFFRDPSSFILRPSNDGRAPPPQGKVS